MKPDEKVIGLTFLAAMFAVATLPVNDKSRQKYERLVDLSREIKKEKK